MKEHTSSSDSTIATCCDRYVFCSFAFEREVVEAVTARSLLVVITNHAVFWPAKTSSRSSDSTIATCSYRFSFCSLNQDGPLK